MIDFFINASFSANERISPFENRVDVDFFKIIGFRRVVFIASVVSFDFYFSSTDGEFERTKQASRFPPVRGKHAAG